MLNLSTSLSGIQAAIHRLNTSAHNIANLNTPGYRALGTASSEATDGGSDADGLADGNGASNVDLASEEVNLLRSELSVQANINALRAQDAILRQLLEVEAPDER